MLKIPKLKEHSFLVYGLGLSGCSVVNFFKKKGLSNFQVWDDKYKKIFKRYRTKNLNKSLQEVDYIVLSPGISILKNKKLRKFNRKIITDIDLFFLDNKNFKSIVVTGSNGKSTTCKLLSHLLIKNKIRCLLGGNIGNPILNLKSIKKSFIIIEASSFQLSHSKFIRPDFAFFLNFANDHLDWHGSMGNYLNAKLKIFHLQDKKQYALNNKLLKKKFIKRKFLSKSIYPEIKDYKRVKFKINNTYLNSNINDENMSFIFAFSKLINLSEKSFVNSMKTFKGLPHRFEIFLKKKDLTFINDSKATSFTASRIAISSLKNIFWILGGVPKIGDQIILSKFKKNIIKGYLIGKNINFFKSQVTGKISYSVSNNLKNAIIQILRDFKSFKIKNCNILLSPSAASFDQYENFEMRGEEFKKLSKKYARKFL